jgi:hypothetical protein
MGWYRMDMDWLGLSAWLDGWRGRFDFDLFWVLLMWIFSMRAWVGVLGG